MNRIAVFELAKQLRVKPLDVIQSAQRLKIPVIRAAALLTPGQAMRIREELASRPSVTAATVLFAAPAPGPQLRYATCDCCRLHFSYPDNHPTPVWCPTCADHLPKVGETPERQLSRSQDHETRLRARYEAAASAANNNEDRMKSAFRSRQKWKRALAEIVVGHEPTEELGCACGAVRYPCLTLRLLEYSNKGIFRECERLASLSPEALEAELNRHEPWRFDRFDLARDDDPLVASSEAAQAESA